MLTVQLNTFLELILAFVFLLNDILTATNTKSTNSELKFQVKVKLQGLNPHPVIQTVKLEQKTIPVPFLVTYIEFNSDTHILDLTNGKIDFLNPNLGLKYTTFFYLLNHFRYKTSYTLFFSPKTYILSITYKTI